MSKGPDAFRTISEVAEDLDVPQHVLRFWETRFTTVRPLKRGGGRRYYRPDDVDLLKGIRHLLYGQGYTIRGVQRILKDDGPRAVQAIGRGEPVVLPRPQAAEDDGDGDGDAPEAVSATGGEGMRPGEGRAGPVASVPGAPALPAQARPDLAARERDLLRTALEELLECQRTLEALKRS